MDYLLIKLSTKWYLVGKSGIYAYISTQIRIMINLTGTYECRVDVKGRFMLPVALKKQLQNGNIGFELMKNS